MTYQEALKIESQLSAINALAVGNTGPYLNAKGDRLLEEARLIIRNTKK